MIKSGYILRLHDSVSKIDIDVMVNKKLEILNSMLLLEYCLVDPRVRKVAQVLKVWSKKSGSVYYRKEQLNNYSLYLMLIAFMQH